MFQANLTPYFLRKAKKIVAKNFDLAKEVDNCIQNLESDPRMHLLKSHKVKTPRFGDCFSSSINGDLRIIWDYSDSEVFVLDLLDIGGHSGSNSVY